MVLGGAETRKNKHNEATNADNHKRVEVEQKGPDLINIVRKKHGGRTSRRTRFGWVRRGKGEKKVTKRPGYRWLPISYFLSSGTYVIHL